MTPFPITARQPIEHNAALPQAADVVVIGGGIIGITTAWELARRGLQVALVEKGRVAGEQSSRNWGWVRVQGRDVDEIPIMLEARSLWAQLQRESGEDLGLVTAGVSYLARKPGEMAEFEDWMPHARANGLDTRLMSGAEVAKLLPDAARRWAGGMITPSDMKAEPWVAVPAMARAAVRAGVVIREGCAARMIETSAGRVSGVVTSAGVIRCAAVVVAGGAWSSLLLRQLGISIPQLSVRATVAATAPMPEVIAGAAADSQLAWRRRRDGGYTLAPAAFHEFMIGPDAVRHFGSFIKLFLKEPFQTALLPKSPKGYPDAWGTARKWASEANPFEDMPVLNPAPHKRTVAKMASQFSEIFPQLGKTQIKTSWAGMIDTMPDVVPVVDRAEALPGLVIATGMCGHGFGIGPAFGRITADLVMENAVGHDLHRFRLSRFSDGSRLAAGPAL